MLKDIRTKPEVFLEQAKLERPAIFIVVSDNTLSDEAVREIFNEDAQHLGVDGRAVQYCTSKEGVYIIFIFIVSCSDLSRYFSTS